MGKTQNKGLIFDIERYGLHDGPGIRTVIFFKGCLLKCLWCQNPEGQSPKPEIFFFKEKCLQDCNACVQICPVGAIRPIEQNGEKVIDLAKCTFCNQCVAQCPGNALVLTGKYSTASEIIDEVQKNSVFYRHSDGGITLSGGEPLLQDRFALEVLQKCHALGIHTAVETSGFLGWHRLGRILPYVNLLLYDLKHMSADTHQTYTGVDNKIILANLKRIDLLDIPIIIRIPIVPGCTNRLADLKESAEFCKTLRHLERVDLLPYHQMGEAKYARLRRAYPLQGVKPPTPEEMERIKKLFTSRHMATQSGG